MRETATPTKVATTPYESNSHPLRNSRPNSQNQKIFTSKKIPGRSAPTAFPGRPQYLWPFPRASWQTWMTAPATLHAITASRAWHPHATPAAHAHGILCACGACAPHGACPVPCLPLLLQALYYGRSFSPLPFAPLRASAENHGEILCNFFYPPIRGIAVWPLLTALPAPCYHAAEATQQLAGWQGAKNPHGIIRREMHQETCKLLLTATATARKEVRV